VAKQYFDLLKQGCDPDDPQLREARQKLDEVTAHYADNPAADALIELQRISAEGAE